MPPLLRPLISVTLGLASFAAALAASEAQTADTITVPLDPTAGATAAGYAVLMADAPGTSVELALTGLAAGVDFTVTMHAGSCDVPGASFSQLPTLTAAADGSALANGAVLFRGSDPVALSTMADGEHVIVVAGESGVVACGVISPPAPAGVPALPGGATSGPTIAVPLDAVRGATVAGTARLSASGDGTRVELALTGLDAGAPYTATMHSGLCEQPGASFATLPSVTADGSGVARATGTILFRGAEPVADGTMTAGRHVILIAGDSGVVACGVIPSLALGPAETGGAGLLEASDRVPPASAALAAAVAAALALGARRVAAARRS